MAALGAYPSSAVASPHLFEKVAVPRDFERRCAEEELDVVYTATPWEAQVPVCLAAMKNGKHATTEIPVVYTIEECWQLVETSDKTGRHLCTMEDASYMPDELVIYNRVRPGGLGGLSDCRAKRARVQSRCFLGFATCTP